MIKLKKINLIILICLWSCSDMNTNKQNVDVPKISIKDVLSFDNVSMALEQNTPLNKVDWLEWEEFPTSEVGFRIAHDDSLLFLKYYVKEEHVLAEERINSQYTETVVLSFLSIRLKTETITILNSTVSALHTWHMGPDEGSVLYSS